MCARMTKLEAIRTVKRANNRLKPVGDICYDFAYQRGKRLPEKEQQLMLARLERELSPDDTAGPALNNAVEAFWRGFFEGADSERQGELANAVYVAVRQVQSDRWVRLKAKYGKLSHYFDGFGQIKQCYRKPQEEDPEPPTPLGCALVLAMMSVIALLIWWLL